tara:strand:+ start:395 stop:967 length:573 start_codon:yes stop_codon:yes gene_type:complete
MFAFKKKYFLMIESIKNIDLSNIKKNGKFNIIYRFNKKYENVEKLLDFRKICKCKKIGFFVANDEKLAINLKADGIYLSTRNKKLSYLKFKNTKYKIIGAAHNIKELNHKILQGCENIFISRLFKTSYPFKTGYLGVVRYNLFCKISKNKLTALGGIRLNNLNKLKLIKSNSVAFLSEIKKKPTISSRLF